jgi:hypothetical protein
MTGGQPHPPKPHAIKEDRKSLDVTPICNRLGAVGKHRGDTFNEIDTNVHLRGAGRSDQRAIAESGAAQSVDTLRCLISQVSPSGTRMSR